MSLQQLGRFIVDMLLKIGLTDHVDQMYVRDVVINRSQDVSAHRILSSLVPQLRIFLDIVRSLRDCQQTLVGCNGLLELPSQLEGLCSPHHYLWIT
jgi:hypothetical protein